MKLVTVIGARPQFIKSAVVSHALALRQSAVDETVVHTGQHFDDNMSTVFFRELSMKAPNYHLGMGGGAHGAMTGRMLEGVERVLLEHRPDCVLVFGDTNSTLAGALAAAKLGIPVAHVEAGVRSFNRAMPEEINRVLVDAVASRLFCPSQEAVENLAREGVQDGVELVGDVMHDAIRQYAPIARDAVSLDQFHVQESGFALCTIHRAETADRPERLLGIWTALTELSRSLRVCLPAHPRVRASLESLAVMHPAPAVHIIDPVSYLEMIRLEQSARVILTDSGGVQKEAFYLGVPCLTLRDETEWPETVALGRNVLCGTNTEQILRAMQSLDTMSAQQAYPAPYGDGFAADRIALVLESIS